jgi:hypothetical protein
MWHPKSKVFGPLWTAGLGWEVVRDGLVPFVHQGPALSLGLRWQSFEVGVAGQMSLPVEPTTEYGTLRFLRPVACLWGGLEHLLAQELTLGARVRAGVVGYHRSTPQGSLDVFPEEAQLLGTRPAGGARSDRAVVA